MPNLQEYNKNFPLVSLQELIKNKYTFYIPSFQRGYRWGELEVWDLLCDLAEFVTDENKTQYLLQPLVVRKTHQQKRHPVQGALKNGGPDRT